MPSNRNGPIGFGVSFGSLCFIMSVITDARPSDELDLWMGLLLIDCSDIASGVVNESGGGPADEIVVLAAVIKFVFGFEIRSFGTTVMVDVVETAVNGGGLFFT